jgi:hypothetical protein
MKKKDRRQNLKLKGTMFKILMPILENIISLANAKTDGSNTKRTHFRLLVLARP